MTFETTLPRPPERLSHWIAGAPYSDSGATLTVLGPHTREAVAVVPVGGAAVVDHAVSRASAAQPAWADLAPVERGRVLVRLSQLMREHSAALVATEVREAGKLEGEMVGGVQVAADYFEFYGGVVRALFGETINIGAGDHAFTSRDPYGVVAMITPWNGPLTQASRGIAAALAAGNAVVVKPSEFTPSTTLMLAELAQAAGLPTGVLNVVLGTGEDVGAALVEHPDVRLVAFTGSVATGRRVAEAAARRLAPSILELGGKSPNIVFGDADLDGACASALTICVGGGQQCSALSRLIVHESIHDRVLERVTSLMAARTPGKLLMPMTTEDQFRKVLEYFSIAEREGARLMTGGRAAEGELARGRYVLPTVYADVTPRMRIFQEEIFGPVLTVTRFSTEAEAIALANDSEYGLAASIWTANVSRALRVANRIDAGQVIVNGGRSGIEMPFGGFKASGIGREKGFESLMHYTQVKTTIVSRRT